MIVGKLIGYSIYTSYVDKICFVSLSLRTLRESFIKSISLISGLLRLCFLLVTFNSVDSLFQEFIHRLYIHFNPNVVLLYDGMQSLPVVACLVEYS